MATTSGTDLAYGIYAEAGTNALTNCNATVSVNTISSYGAYHKAGSLSIIGGVYNVEAKQATAAAAQNTMLYGLYNEAGMTTTVTGTAFNVTATNASYAQYVYGAYINGTLNSTSTTYNVTACRYVYGMQGMGSSNLVLANNTIRVEATNANTANNNSSWSYGIYAKKNFTINGDKVDAIGQIKDVYAMFFDSSTSKGDVLDGKFSAQGNGTNGYGALNASATVGKVYLKGGVYKSAINLAKYAYTDYKVYNMDGSHPDYADGYRYTIATENPSPYVCRIVGGAYYTTLKEALQYTLDNSGNYTIVMTQPHTLPAGEYTLPANATLVIPYKFDQNAITVQGSNPANPDTRITAGLVENFLCLTIADGVHLNVNGKIGVGGELFCQQTNKSSYINGPYGRIHMEEGSLIQLNSGSFLYAWGMITGNGNIIVKNNAEVHEMFQVGDMKSASNLATYYNNNSEKFFPITQYGILNIEVPTTYYYNSRLIGALLCYYPGLGGVYYGEKNIKLVGTENALFEITTEDETTWVRKSYKNARQVWDINSSAKLGSISINISVSGMSSSFNSANYILPITYNMDMHVLSGDFEITHNAELLPGSTIEIDKTASLTINEGQKLYVFDKDQWPLSSSYDDAAINVHGNINVEGFLYTSNKGSETSKTDGANIYSSNADAGTIFFETAAPAATSSIDLITSINTSGKVKKTITMDPAQLKNGTGASQAFTPTSGTAADHSFAYMNNVWTPTYTNECFEVIGENVYVKPSEYVQLKKSEIVGGLRVGVEEEDHTYLTIDDKVLILMMGCQWWEVEEVEGTTNPKVFECKKPGYEGFYYYDDSDPLEWPWKLKTVNVDFYSSETGDNVLKRIVTDFKGIPDQAVIATNPTKATTAGYTYQFYGWKSSVTGDTIPWTDQLEVATADMSYRPVFTETKRNYTITLINANNGATVPLEVPYGDTPEYTPKKDATAQYTYTFNGWSPAFQSVTGAATYTAQWTSTVNEYNITWKNGDDVLEVDENQPYGTATAYNGASLPTKATDNEYEYAFSKWKSSLNGNSYNNGSTPTVAGETTYEAQYTTTPRYAITFNNYDGTQLARTIYTEGEHPAYDGVPARKRDADGYFVFSGWKDGNGTFYAKNATLPAVTDHKETYTAQYTYTNDLFTITLNNVDGNGATWSGKFGVGSTPFYDPNEDDVPDTPTKAGNAQYSYPFTGWTPALEPVSGPATYTAQFGQQTNSYTITFANIDGHCAHEDVVLEYGATPAYSEVVPMYTEGLDIYTFRAWKRSYDQLEYTTLPDVEQDETYTAQYDKVDNLAITGNTTITSDASLGTTTVYVSGALNVSDDATLTTTNLILKAEAGGSGQIYKEPSSNISATNVYYDLSLNTDARHWRAFGVPWAVDLNTNKLEEVDNNGIVIRTLNISHDYEIMYFDGAERAANGPSPACWKYLRHYEDTEHGQPVDVLTPGQGYMIAFGSHVNTVRFTKKEGAPIIFDGTVSVAAGQICGISNPMAYHVTLSNIGATVGQVHDGGEIGHDDYTPVDIDDKRFVVGKTVYIEPAASGTVVVNKADGGVSPIAAAPARRGMATDKQYLSLSDYYTIALTPEDGSQVAKVYVLPEEDKEDRYVAGHDLAKMGMSDRKAQIWVERYDAQLGLNTTAPMNGVAEFPIYVYAPKAGEYTIGLASQPDDDYTVYLLRDGVAIWDLSTSEYALTLGTGKDNSFALRLSARKSPEVATGVDEAIVDAQGKTRKVLIDNKVFIIRGNQVYTIDGQLVK